MCKSVQVAWTLWLAAFAVATGELEAATRTKANNADNLNLASSWTNGIAPVGSDVALFDATVTGPLAVELGADGAWNQINFANPGGDVTITSGNRLTFSNNIPVIFGAGVANLTLNCDVDCAGVSFTTLPSAPAGRTITYGGVLQGRDATVTLGNSPGTLRLANSGSRQIGAVAQATTSGPKIGIGASSLGNPIASGPLGTNQFTWNSISGTELFAFNGSQTLGNALRIQASPLIFNSADDLTFTGVVDLNNGSRTLAVSNSGILRFTGTVSNGNAIVKTGPGTLELGGANVAAFGGGLSIFGGTLRLLANDVIPDGPGKGTVRMTNTTEVLDLNGFSETINGMIGTGAAGVWAGTVDNTAPGTTSILTLGDEFTYTLAGKLQNSAPGSTLALVKIGTGGLILTNAQTFSGGITISSACQVSINSAGAAGTGPVVISSPELATELTYGGGGSLTWSNDILLAASARPAINADDGSALEIAGVIRGPGQVWRNSSFDKQGALAYSGDNTFTGGFVLTGGAVTLNHPRAVGLGLLRIGDPSVFTGASLILLPGVDLAGGNAITNAVLVNRDFTVGGTNAIEFAGAMVWVTNAAQRSINVTNLTGVVISGPVGGYGFNKTGQGLLTFNGICSHDGPSTVSVGPLALGAGAVFTGATRFLVGGSGQLDVSAVADFTIRAAQTLSGSGKISGDVTVNGSFNPGDVISTLTFSNSLTLASDSITTVRVSRNFPFPEKVVCMGTLIYGGSLVVSNVGPALQLGDSFDLFGFTGSPGGFASLTLPTLADGLAWNTSRLAIDGTISVVSTTAAGPQLLNPQLVGSTNFLMTIRGGITNGQFRILSQTNVAEPIANWQFLSTNTYDGSGNLTVTNLLNPAAPQRYFRIVQP